MIYFIARPSDGLIKIGTTKSLSNRLRSLAREHAEPLKLLGVLDGGRDREAELHVEFAGSHVEGEWFYPHGHLLAFIELATQCWDGSDEISRKPIRLALSPTDYDRLAECAKAKGLSLAAFARMAVLRRIEQEEMARSKR